MAKPITFRFPMGFARAQPILCAFGKHPGSRIKRMDGLALISPSYPPHRSAFLVRRVEQHEPGPAFELALGGVAGCVDLALPRLAQKTRLDRKVAFRGQLLAALLDEDAADWRFAPRRWSISAVPAGRTVVGEDRKPQEMRQASRRQLGARIGD